MIKLAVIVAGVLAFAGSARADIARYAIVAGNNLGDRGDAELRYAERDAERFAGALVDLGGFPAANVVVLTAGDAETLRSTVIAINDRIRGEHAAEAMLVVYYSGHADASGLHLGRTTLEIAQLEQLVRGSAASFRLLALDACRSGVLTQVKGGRLAPPIPIVVGDTLAADGVVFWTASAASEDAQESDEIQGSFFTHYLVSGLAGAADVNADGKVTTGEAFEHARAATLRASSRTLAGPQHATFRDEVHGRQDIVLTSPGAAGRMAAIELPADRDVVVLAGSETGRVVSEIGAQDRGRRLALRPGRYFIRERTDGYLLEGTIAVVAGAPRRIDDRELTRVAYAALVRKGGRGRQDALEVGVATRTALLDGGGLCTGVVAGYLIALPWISVAPRLAVCREHMANALLSTALTELTADVRVTHTWDLGRVALAAGGALGGAVLHQAFTTTGTAPSRSQAALTFGIATSAALRLTPGLALAAQLDLASYVFRRLALTGPPRWTTPLALRSVLALELAW